MFAPKLASLFAPLTVPLGLLTIAASSPSARGDGAPPPARAAANAAASTLSVFAAKKAEALLRGHLPCLGCHALGGDGGRIGPDLSTVGARRSFAYIDAMLADPQRTVPGSAMPKTAMTTTLRTQLARYLAAQSASRASPATEQPPTPPPPAVAPTEPPNGSALYARWCSACHGERGRGDGPNARYLPKRPPAHADKTAMAPRPDDALFDVISAGGNILEKGSRMPAFGATLSASEIRALVAHIRTLCACEGPAWSRDGAGRR